MKIVKQPPNWQSRELTCTGAGNGGKGCKAVLLVDLEDLRHFSEREGYMRVYEEAVCFRCPCCGRLTDLPKDAWPNQPAKNLKAFSSHWKNTGEDPERVPMDAFD